jgi:hypothetical protein
VAGAGTMDLAVAGAALSTPGAMVTPEDVVSDPDQSRSSNE